MNFTNFGFKKVNINEKANLVKDVFSSVANKYDLMNDLMSFGIHRIWKEKMLSEVTFLDKNPKKFLDLAAGTGDIAFKIASKSIDNGIKASIEVADINPDMLEIGKKRAIDRNLLHKLNFTEADGENLPYKKEEFDFYTIAFGIRNFTNIQKGLNESYRVLKKGGKFICLEFSKVDNDFLSRIYDLYSFNVIPKIGKIVTGDKDSYQYLVESIKNFPDAENFKEMITMAGFKKVSYKLYTFGTVAIHVAVK